eukprot:CAMPEP_0172520078 /NCGR_PEP_ID=MMETSP1066-20121228/291790_1 /TAXON_ID=671091 /ORGANISM="Coscinodiscus wailesii, Strain CCMP2513" /LENGTH=383 /DNA_ID=CAMNT_0013302771 /DNA_START=112 /DNA_END=1263 /DNA_ORIENTATION=+
MPSPNASRNVQYVSPSNSNSNSGSQQQQRVLMEKIRTPHPHDVLCGRGGGINSHAGNKTFRDWVRERKESYNLAPSKAAKAQVSREILDRVRALDPPGRFLTREEPGVGSSIFWVEIDDTKAMAKTSQALREGAPSIRAKAKAMEMEMGHSVVKGGGKTAYKGQRQANVGNVLVRHPGEAFAPLSNGHNGNNGHNVAILPPPAKIQKLCQAHNPNEPTPTYSAAVQVSPALTPQETTPNLLPVPYTNSPPIAPLPPSSQELPCLPVSLPLPFQSSSSSPKSRKRQLPRTHSLALSDITADLDDITSDFKDPFASEEGLEVFDSFPEIGQCGNHPAVPPSTTACRPRLSRLASATGANSTTNNHTGKGGDSSIRSVTEGHPESQ